MPKRCPHVGVHGFSLQESRSRLLEPEPLSIRELESEARKLNLD